MSELTSILNASVIDRAPATTDPVKNLTRNFTFTAEIEGNLDPFTIPESLGSDPRAKINLFVTDNIQASKIQMQDKVQFKLYGQLATAQIVWRYLDPASAQTKFIAAQILAKDSA